MIDPSPKIANKTISICSGETFTVTPTNTGSDIVPVNTTYTWTVASNVDVEGESNQPTGQTSISQTLTNTSNTVKTVIYTVRPTYIPGNCVGSTFQVSVQVNPKPVIQASTETICKDGPLPVLSTIYGGTGTPTYQWFSNATNSNTGGSAITTNGTSASYSPPTSAIGTTYYYVELTFSSGGCTLVKSNPAKIEVVTQPTVSTQPEALRSICVGGSVSAYSVAHTGGTGNPTYQWYSNTTNSNTGGTAITTNGTSASYTPPASDFIAVGDYYYYAVISLNGSGCNTATSSVARVQVVADPVIGNQPLASQIQCLNATPTNLSVTLSGGLGTASYQWYSNITNSNTGGTAISTNGTSASFTPPTTAIGTTYYYVEVIQDVSGCKVISNTASVQVVPHPTVSTQPEALRSICVGGSVSAYSVAHTGGTGNPTYQWYSNTTNSNTGGTAITTNGTSASYTPPASDFIAVGDYYYYAVISLNGSGCNTATSNVARVQVVADPVIGNQPLASQIQCLNANPTNLSVTLSGGLGTASYQWYSNTTNSNTGGTAISTNGTSASYTPPTTAIGTTYYYVEVIQDVSGCKVISNTASVQVVPHPTVSTQPEALRSICVGGSVSAYSVAHTGGTGNPTYQWYSNTTNSNTGGTAITTNGTSASYTPPASDFIAVGDYYYYAVISLNGSGCNTATSNVARVQVVADPVIGNQPLASQIQCLNANPTNLSVTLSGGLGTASYQWYSNTTNSNTGGTAISTNGTSASYTPPTTAIGTTYYYVEVIQDVSGCKVISNTASVQVVPHPTVSTQPEALRSICVGGSVSAYSVAHTGGTGNPTYQWYSNTTNSNTGGTAITTNGTSASYTPPASDFIAVGDYYYYAVISLNGSGCNTATSNVARVQVVADPVIGNQPLASQIQCLNANPTNLSVTLSGGLGTASYQWYSNTTNSNTGGTAISTNGTSASYTPPTTAIGTTYYYVEVIQDVSGCKVISNTASVQVVPHPTVSTQPEALRSICVGGSVSAYSVAHTGGTGNPTYQWYSNTTNSNTGGTAITTNGTSASYTPPASDFIAVGDYYYYAVISLNGSGCNTATSNVARVQVVADPVIGNQPLASQIQCLNANPTNLSVTLSGGLGTASYQWYSNTTNSNTGGTAISTNGTSASYTPPTTAIGTTYYYVEVIQDVSGCKVISNTASVQVVPHPTVSTQPEALRSICVGGSVSAYSVAHTGGTGNPTYQWYSNTTNSNTGGTAITTNGTSASYTPPASDFIAVGDYYYYAVISLNGSGCNTATSSVARVQVVADPVIGNQPLASQIQCLNATPTNLSVTLSGGLGTASYQWYSNITNSNTGGTAISTNGTSASFTPPTTAIGTTYYYVEVIQDVSGCKVISNTASVQVVPQPTVSTQPINNTVCLGGTTPALTVAYSGGTGNPTYQWYSNTTNSNTGGTAITTNGTSASYSPPTSAIGTTYYYVELTFSSGGCTLVKSNPAKIEVVTQPTVSTQPEALRSICVGGSVSAYSVAHTGGTGNPTYQWYSNTTNSNTGGTAITTNGTSASYTPPASDFIAVGDYYYYAVISLNGSGCNTATSSVARVQVVADPVIGNQPLASQIQCLNATPTNLSVTLSGGLGTASYQWYSNITNSNTGGTAISTNGTSASFTPPTTAIGTTYYYVEVIQDVSGCKVISNTASVQVVPQPTVSTQPINNTVCLGGTTPALTVAYSGGTGNPTYQWYSNTTNSNTGGTAITTNGTSASYTPPTNAVGIVYYYVELTFSSGGCTLVKSNPAKIEVVTQPTVSTQPEALRSICVGGSVSAYSVAHTGGTGNPTYQWYSNTTNSNTGGTAITTNGTSASYTPPASDFIAVGDYYYYAVISLNGSGCNTATSSVARVQVVADPVIGNQPLASQIQCLNATPTNLSVTLSGGLGTASYQWYSNITNSNTGGTAISTNGTSASFTPPTTAIGTTYYYVEVIQDVSGCKVISNTASVQVVPQPTVSTQPINNTVCLGGTTPALTVAYSGGTGNPTYQWYSNTTNSNTGGTAITTNGTSASYSPPTSAIGTTYYYVELTFSSGGCTLVKSNPAKIEVVTQPTVSTQPEALRSICVGGSVSAYSVAHTGGTGNPTYQWYSNTTNSNTGGTAITTNGTSASYTPPASDFIAVGDYYYYAVISLNGSGCNTATSSVARVQVVADPVIGNQPLASQIQCLNATPTNLSVTLSGGLGTASYQWYSNITNSNTGGTAISTNGTSASFTPPTTAIGTTYYYVEVIQDVSGCKVISNTASVQVVPQPTVSTQPINNTVCLGGTTPALTVAYSGGTGNPTYQWYSNTTNSNTGGTAITTNGTSASYSPPTSAIGTTYYYVELTFSSGGCTLVKSNPAKIEVAEVVLNEVAASRKNILCFGEATGNISVEGTGGTKQYTYSLTGTDYTGAAVSQTSGPTNLNLFSFATLKAGQYVLTLTDLNGCQKSMAPITLTQPLAPLQITNEVLSNYNGLNIACFGDTNASISLQVSGGTAPYRYSWTGPNGFTSTSPDLSNLAVGSYRLTITDAVNCTLAKTYEMRGPDPIAIAATISDYIGFQISCKGGSDGVIDLNITGGNGGYQIFWEGPAGFRSNLPKIEGLLPGKYEVTVIDSKNCTLKQEYTLLAPDEFLISPDDVKVTEVSCFNGSNGAIAITIKKATLAPYRYEISGNSSTGLPVSKSIQSNNLSYQFTGLRAGSYTLRISDAVGCTIAVNATIKETAIFDLTETVKNVSCLGKKDGAISLRVIGGSPPFKVQWAHGPKVPNLNNLDKGVYSVLITDTGGCSIEKQFVITEPQALDLSATVTDALDCVDQNTGSISVNPFGGTPPYTYTWSNGSKTQNLSAVGPGSYSLELVDANGCRILRQFTVNHPLPLEVSVAQTTVRVCEPRGLKSNFKVTVKGGIAPYTVTWNRGTQTNAGLVMDTQELGVFVVTVKDARGCTQVKRIEVLETDPLIPEFDYTSTSFELSKENLVNFEVQFKNLSAGKFKEASWDFGDGVSSTAPDPTHKYVKAGTYIVQLKLKDLSDCIVSFSKEIVINDYYLTFPTVFSPNQDGVNDYFYPKFLHISAIHVVIMNKWGELVYESKDIDAKGWDGLYKGEKAPIGNYVCKVRHTTLDGRVIDQSSVFYLGR